MCFFHFLNNKSQNYYYLNHKCRITINEVLSLLPEPYVKRSIILNVKKIVNYDNSTLKFFGLELGDQSLFLI